MSGDRRHRTGQCQCQAIDVTEEVSVRVKRQLADRSSVLSFTNDTFANVGPVSIQYQLLDKSVLTT